MRMNVISYSVTHIQPARAVRRGKVEQLNAHDSKIHGLTSRHKKNGRRCWTLSAGHRGRCGENEAESREKEITDTRGTVMPEIFHRDAIVVSPCLSRPYAFDVKQRDMNVYERRRYKNRNLLCAFCKTSCSMVGKRSKPYVLYVVFLRLVNVDGFSGGVYRAQRVGQTFRLVIEWHSRSRGT